MRSNMVFEPTEVAVTFCTIWAVKVFQFALSRIYQLCTSRISIVTLFTSFSVIIAQLVQKLTKTMTSEQTISVINMEKTFLGYPLVQTHMFPIQTRVVATFCTRLANISFFWPPPACYKTWRGMLLLLLSQYFERGHKYTFPNLLHF